MNWTQQQNIRLGFWLAALVPLILGLLGFLALRSLFADSETLAHSNQTIRQLDRVYVELSDLESAESEFVMSPRDAAVQRYETASKRLAADINRLSELADPQQQEWVEHLRALFDSKRNEVRQVMELRREEGVEGASRLREALGRQGTRTIDDIRTSIRKIRDDEERQLKDRTQSQTRSRMYTMVMFVLILGLNVSLIYSLRALIHREAAEARREKERIRQLNAELESRVEQRTAALQRSNEDLQQFAYVVSHDLQEPLRMVASYTELLRRRYGGRLDKDADEYISYAVDGVKRMTTLIRDLLDYARAGATSEVTEELVDTEEVLKTVLLNLQSRIEQENATVTYDALPRVMTHRVGFTQIMQNLVANSLKYRSERPPEVHVFSRTGVRETVFGIKDNGVGIDPRYADQVFAIFKRLHGREVEGTGIGLATCKRIVERSGGRIWFESTPGQGSTFYFSIPATTAAPAATAP